MCKKYEHRCKSMNKHVLRTWMGPARCPQRSSCHCQSCSRIHLLGELLVISRPSASKGWDFDIFVWRSNCNFLRSTCNAGELSTYLTTTGTEKSISKSSLWDFLTSGMNTIFHFWWWWLYLMEWYQSPQDFNHKLKWISNCSAKGDMESKLRFAFRLPRWLNEWIMV